MKLKTEKNIFDKFSDLVNGNEQLDHAYLNDRVNNHVDTDIRRIQINTSAVANIGVTANNPYYINFPFKRLVFNEIVDTFGNLTPSYEMFCTLVIGKKGDLIQDNQTIILRYGDVIEFDNIQRDAYFYFPQGSVTVKLLFSRTMKFNISNSVTWSVLSARVLHTNPVTVTTALTVLSNANAGQKRSIYVYNNNAVGGENIYVSSSNGVTSANGFPIPPQNYMEFMITGALYAKTNVGTANVRILERIV